VPINLNSNLGGLVPLVEIEKVITFSAGLSGELLYYLL